MGKHCAMAGCRQKDFLPFTCPTCARHLCLEHRRFADHGCSAPDATSMECPICHKSIKMDRSDDPNIVWESHFTTSCTQQPARATTQTAPVCAACPTRLGPSNTFSCPKCGSKVCMSHRMPDGHNCAAVRRSNADRRGPTGGSKNSRLLADTAPSPKPGAAAQKSKNSKAGARKDPDPANTLAGTAQRRAERLAGNNPPAEPAAFSCPMCSATRSSLDLITRHIETDHLASDSGSGSAPAPAALPSTGNEVRLRMSCVCVCP